MRALLVVLTAAALLATASCRTTSQHAAQARTPDETCLAWSDAYLETVLAVAADWRRDEPMAAAYLIGDDTWPATERRRAAINEAGNRACLSAMADRFGGGAVVDGACESQARQAALAGAEPVLRAQARRAGLTGGAGASEPLVAASAVTTLYAEGYDACIAGDAG